MFQVATTIRRLGYSIQQTSEERIRLGNSRRSLTLTDYKANKSQRFLERGIMVDVLVTPCLAPNKSILNAHRPFWVFLLCPYGCLFLRDLFTMFQTIKRSTQR